MAKREKFYKKVNRARFHRSSPRQDFIFPYVLVESTKYKGCWRLKYSHVQQTQKCTYDGENWSSVRLSYHLNVKNIPRRVDKFKKGLGTVRHTCKHAWCVNPRHLYMSEIATSEQVKLKKEEKEKRILAKYPWKTKEWRLAKARPRRPRRERKKWPKNGYIKHKLATHWHHMMKKIYYWGA